jgi:DNA-binding XRE family transcriptional regulator
MDQRGAELQKALAAKSDTRSQVKNLRLANLHMKMSEIAETVGVSRQRVFQILQDEGLTTKQHVKKCLYGCPMCGKITSHKYCSSECRKEWLQIPVICSECGNLFIRSRRQFLNCYPNHNNVLFCSKKCVGKWLNKNYVLNNHINRGGIVDT